MNGMRAVELLLLIGFALVWAIIIWLLARLYRRGTAWPRLIITILVVMVVVIVCWLLLLLLAIDLLKLRIGR